MINEVVLFFLGVLRDYFEESVCVCVWGGGGGGGGGYIYLQMLSDSCKSELCIDMSLV